MSNETSAKSVESFPVLAGIAQARLEVSYGMSELGALRLLGDARTNGSAKTVAVCVTLVDLYPERFEITARAASKEQ